MPNPDAYLPDILGSRLPNSMRRASRARDRAELEVYEYGLDAWVDSTKDQIDTAVLGEAVRASLEEEMDTYDEMMLLAGDSAVKRHLVVQRLSMMSNKNNSRIRRRFS